MTGYEDIAYKNKSLNKSLLLIVNYRSTTTWIMTGIDLDQELSLTLTLTDLQFAVTNYVHIFLASDPMVCSHKKDFTFYTYHSLGESG